MVSPLTEIESPLVRIASRASQAYESAICSCLDDPGSSLLSLLRRWPPTIYRPSHIKHAVMTTAHARPGGLQGAPHLLQAMSLLHCHAGEHEAALRLQLLLPRGDVDLFGFVEKHALYAACSDKV